MFLTKLSETDSISVPEVPQVGPVTRVQHHAAQENSPQNSRNLDNLKVKEVDL